MFSFLQQHFNRKLSTQRSYIAAADGIRCLAILHVLFGHINIYVATKSDPLLNYTPLQTIIGCLFASPGLGLNIFFVLSGFLLVIPFANFHLFKQAKPSLVEFYLRRIVRLELPYFIALTFSAIILVFVIQKYDLLYLLPRYISSIFYSNHIIYGVHPEALPIAWSLEVEVLFYILVPAFGYIFKLGKISRRIILLLAIIGFPLLAHQFPFLYKMYFLGNCQYFFAGILAADFYITKDLTKLSKRVVVYTGVILFAFIFWYIGIFSNGLLMDCLLYPLPIAAFIYLVIAHNAFSNFFSNFYIRVIGLMSYTIYLWHYMIISGVMGKTMMLKIGNLGLANLLLQSCIVVPIVLAFSAFLFLLIEKPCMYSTLSKNWAKKLFKTT